MTYFVYLNGPPKSGKDTIANLLAERYENVVHVKFAQVLRDAVCGIFDGMSPELYDMMKDSPGGVKCCTEYDSGALDEMTLREFVIRLSEKVLKPNFGKGYLGVALAETINAKLAVSEFNDNTVYIVSDLGFPDELTAFRFRMAFTTDSLLIYLHRKGCNFDNDSRNYVTDVISPVSVHNDGTIEQAVNEVESLIRDMLIHYSDSLRESK